MVGLLLDHGHDPWSHYAHRAQDLLQGAGLRPREGRAARSPIEGLKKEPELVMEDVVAGLGTVREPLNARERQHHELNTRRHSGAQWWEASDVARRGDGRHTVAPLICHDPRHLRSPSAAATLATPMQDAGESNNCWMQGSRSRV